MTMPITAEELECLRAELACLRAGKQALERHIKEEQARALREFPFEFQFWVTPVTLPPPRNVPPLYDHTLRWYWVAGKLANAAEYAALGGSASHLQGDFCVLFNPATGLIVFRNMSIGLYVRDFGSIVADLSRAIVANPEGKTDVTDIIVPHLEITP